MKLTHQEFSSKGGKASALKMTPEERKEKAKMMAQARWGKKVDKETIPNSNDK